MANYLQQFKSMLESITDEELKSNLTNAYKNVELDFKSSLESRDNAKSELKSIKSILKEEIGAEGVDEIKTAIESIKKPNVENLDGYKSELKEKYENDAKTLREMAEAEKLKYEELKSSHEEVLFEIEVENQGLLKGFNVENPRVRAMLMDEIKSNTIFEDGKLFVKDATTGDKAKDIKTNDYVPAKNIVENMVSSEEWSSFVNPSLIANGSGANAQQGSGGNAGGINRSKMSHSEKGAYIKEHGSEAYLKLPN